MRKKMKTKSNKQAIQKAVISHSRNCRLVHKHKFKGGFEIEKNF